MNPSETGVREHLDRITADRRTIEHERHLLDAWSKSLDREERMARRALEHVDESGQARLVNPLTMRPYKPQSKPEHRQAIVDVFARCGPAYDRRMPQREIERHTALSSGTLSRAVRDLEAEGVLFRVGQTAKGSPLWSDVRPAEDPR